jgi:FemAB-related protein (PEP-CTERM system-associated)
MMDIVTDVSEVEWKSFLDNCDEATIYHTPEWKRFLKDTFAYEPLHIFAKDDTGQITGMLPLFYIKSKLTGNRLCSTPFSHSCGLVGNQESFDSLINGSLDIFGTIDAKYIEIRDNVNSDKFQTNNSFSTYILDVSKNVDVLWTELSSNARRSTRQSKKNGLSVRVTRDMDDLKSFYQINSMTKKEIGVPCHPWKFFRNLFDVFKENVSLYIVEYNDEMIAGGIRTYYKDTVIAGYAASNPEFVNMRPYNILNWQTIEDSSKSNYKYYDLGRVSYDNEGLMFFKSRWGTVEKKLYYSFYPENPMSIVENRDNMKFKIATNMMKRIPMPIYQQFSNVLFKNFG